MTPEELEKFMDDYEWVEIQLGEIWEIWSSIFLKDRKDPFVDGWGPSPEKDGIDIQYTYDDDDGHVFLVPSAWILIKTNKELRQVIQADFDERIAQMERYNADRLINQKKWLEETELKELERLKAKYEVG